MKIPQALLLAPILAKPPAAQASPTVVLSEGTVVGTAASLPSSTVVVNQFLGIPFAKPPTGKGRFMPPEPIERFPSQPFNATAWGHICLQQSNPWMTPDQVAAENEDCLNVNVYTPAHAMRDGRPREVLVWIHGGNLQNGFVETPNFDGTSFATNHDIVVTTLSYRLNAWGFSNSPEIPLEQRNVGFLDQRLALKWIHKNIAKFGGDPSKITIAGESSGASSVDRLVTLPPCNRPFRAAICESGQATVSAFARDQGPAAWAQLVAAVNCTGSASELACVQGVDAQTIRILVDSIPGINFSPVNDNVTQHELPYADQRAAGQAAKVPLMISTTAEEGTLLALQNHIDIDAFDEAALEVFLTPLLGNNPVLYQQISGLIHQIAQQDNLSLFFAVAKAFTEAVYQCPAKLVSSASATAGVPTWRYYWNASFPNMAYAGYPQLGATHVSDLLLIWGTYPTAGATEQQTQLSKYTQTAYASFVKDPWGAGPGWAKVDGATGANLVCLGCNGSSSATPIDEAAIDARCPFYDGFYPTVHTPLF